MPATRPRTCAGCHAPSRAWIVGPALWRAIRVGSRGGPNPQMAWSSAIWRGVLVGAAVLAGAALGELGYGAAAGFGLLNVALIPAGIGRSTLTRVCLGLVPLAALAAFFSVLVAGTWWQLLLLPVLGYLFGSLGGRGLAALNLTIGPLASAIGLSGAAGTPEQACLNAMFLMSGGAVGAVLLVAAWPRERLTAMRRSTATALHRVGAMARAGPDAQVELRAAQDWFDAVAMMERVDLRPSQRDFFDRLLAVSASLRLVVSRLQASEELGVVPASMLAARLRRVAQAITHPSVRPRLADQPLSALPEPLISVVGELEAIVHRGIGRPLEVGSAALTVHNEQPAAGYPDESGSRTSVLTALRPGSPTGRGGVRVALAIAIATCVSLWLEIGHGYWIAMAAAMVMQPDFASTLQRCTLRIGGTIAAVVIVGVTISIAGPLPWVYAALVALAAPFMLRWVAANAFLSAMAIACTMLMLSEAAGPSPQLPGLRLVNTIVGCAIALAVFVAVPSWQRTRLRPALRRMVAEQSEWTSTVLNGVMSRNAFDPVVSRRLASQSRRAVTDARATTEAVLIEPHGADVNADAGFALLVATEGLGILTLALESVMLAGGPRLLPSEAAAHAHVISAQLVKACESLEAELQLDGDLDAERQLDRIGESPAADATGESVLLSKIAVASRNVASAAAEFSSTPISPEPRPHPMGHHPGA